MKQAEREVAILESVFATLAIAVLCLVVLAGCASEEEKVHKKQVEVCRDNVKAGEEPTQFCMNLVPELAKFAQATPQQGYVPPQQGLYQPQQFEQQQQPQQGYVQPQQGYVPPSQPVIINQPTAPQPQSNTLQDMAIGGLIGHAIGSAGNNNVAAAPAGNYQRPVVRERNTVVYVERPRAETPVVKSAPAPVQPPKASAMDTSKLKPYGSRPATAPRVSAMNTSRLSSSGKR